MRKKLSKYLIGIAAVIAVVAIGSFPAFALGASPVALVAAATTAATPLAAQVKLLAVGGSVYAVLQVVKQIFPVAGLGAVLLNVALSVLGVAVLIRPEDLFSLSTLTAVAIAAITAAGAHGTIKSFASSPSGNSSVRSNVAVLVCFTLLSSTFLFTGCNYSQAEVVGAVQKIETGLKTAQSLLPQGKVLLAELEKIDPGAAAEYGPFLDKAGTLLSKAITAADNYSQNPGNDAYQAVLNAVDAITTEADQELFASLKIVNVNTQIKVTGWIALISTGLHVALTIAENYASSKQKKAVPVVTARIPFDQIRPFLKRDYAREELSSMGYKNPDQLLAHAGL